MLSPAEPPRRIAGLVGLVRCLRGALLAIPLALGSAAHAQPSLPFTPSMSARHALTLLVDDAGLALPLSTWPLPAAAVRRALAELPRSLPAQYEQARAVVEVELDAQGGGQVALVLARRADTLVGYGDDYAPASSLRLHGAVFGGPADGRDADTAVIGRLGLRLEADPGPVAQRRGGTRARLDDSAVAVEALGAQLQVATRSAWWGPGWRSSLILGNNAPAMATLSLQRARAGVSESPWLSWLGPWSAEFFMSQAESEIAPTSAWLVGQRVVVRPFAGWEFGASRTAQWGGSGRPDTARNFARMLFGVGSNPSTPEGRANDPGNQMAGFDLRARCPAGWTCAAYAQFIGEDLAHGMPSHYLSQYGLEWWAARSRFNIEYSASVCDSTFNDSQPEINCAYRNDRYPAGYASAGRWLGASQGPDARLLSLSWFDSDHAASLRVDLGRMTAHEFAPVTVFSPAGVFADVKLRAIALQRSYALVDGQITPQLRWQQLAQDGRKLNSYALGAQWVRPLDGQFAGTAPAWAWIDDHPLPAAMALVGLGLALDRPADRYARDHGANTSIKAARRVGDTLPTVALGLAGAHWLVDRGTRAGDTAWAAASSGVVAYAGTRILKSGFGRDRPSDGLGPDSFGHSAAKPRSDSAFPSNHAAIAWAVLTPYAKAYGQDWLYGLAALTSAGRVMGRDHWASDVVAGSLIGYHLGTWSQARLGGSARLSLFGRGVALTTPLD